MRMRTGCPFYATGVIFILFIKSTFVHKKNMFLKKDTRKQTRGWSAFAMLQTLNLGQCYFHIHVLMIR